MAAALTAIATNPALDRVARIAGPATGVVSAEELLETPGGKAVHVASVAAALGCPARVVLAAGGRPGAQILELLADEAGVEAVAVAAAAASRATFTIVAAEGDLVEVHEPGGRLEPAEAESLVEAASKALAGSRIAAICGSLPPGAPTGLHARLVTAAREAGAFTLLDCSTPAAMHEALEAGPDLVAPNRAEALALPGIDAGLPPEGLTAAIRARGAGAVWLSLGADGSVLDDGSTRVRLRAQPAATAVNAVGCGDALLGGFAAAFAAGADPVHAARLGVAAATDKLTHLHPGRVDRDAVEALLGGVEAEPIPAPVGEGSAVA